MTQTKIKESRISYEGPMPDPEEWLGRAYIVPITAVVRGNTTLYLRGTVTGLGVRYGGMNGHGQLIVHAQVTFHLLDEQEGREITVPAADITEERGYRYMAGVAWENDNKKVARCHE